MEKANFSEQPLKYQIDVLKVVEQDYTARSQLNEINSQITVGVAGDDVGLIVRQSFMEAYRGENTRAKDLKLLRERIEELEATFEKQKRIEEVQEYCETLISAAQRVLDHSKVEKDADVEDTKLFDHRALEETVNIVSELYKGTDVKKIEVKVGVKRRKTRSVKN